MKDSNPPMRRHLDADLSAVGAKTDAALDNLSQGHDGAAPPRAHALARPAIKQCTFAHLHDWELVHLSVVLRAKTLI